ncbi:MAG: carbon-nitrogen hydrolase family protein [Myxococcales bacterium]|nr:carbon-nitrogen hydrolase family protein [Myxococcales bacterium]
MGIVQFKARREDLRGSRAALSELALEAGEGVDLLVLPEMASTGYVFPDRDAVAAVAEPARGPTWEALSAVARERRCFVVAGFPERDGARLFNSALVIDREGELRSTYRKTLLYDEDLHWAEPGDSGYETFDTGAGRFGVGICMDLNDDRFVAWVRDTAPDAIAFPTNWVRDPDGTDAWRYWAWRLDGVRSALVAADTWGREGTTTFEGRSCVLRDRTVLAWLPEEGDGWARATIPVC